jgi:hypothetical protein
MQSKIYLPALIVIILILAGVALYSIMQYTAEKNIPVNKKDLLTPLPLSPANEQTANTNGKPEEVLKDIVGEDIVCDSEQIKNGCRVDKMYGDFAKGIMPEGYWIATKKENEWHVVVRGNGIPSCEDIDHNSVPKEIFGNCIEKSGDLRFSQ